MVNSVCAIETYLTSETGLMRCWVHVSKQYNFIGRVELLNSIHLELETLTNALAVQNIGQG